MIYKSKTIKNFSKYIIYEDGSIYSLFNNIWRKQNNDKDGYQIIVLTNDQGKKITCKVHRLVAQTFISNPDDKPNINHKDGNKKNNHISNLEWVTTAENNHHQLNTGLKALTSKMFLCSSCSKTIRRYPCQFKTFSKIYCSNDCKNIARRRRIKVNCKNCNSDLERRKSHFENNINGHFCNQFCYLKWKKQKNDFVDEHGNTNYDAPMDLTRKLDKVFGGINND
jgi:hypothetical protein